MNRISAVLLFGIIALMMLSSYLIYDTWIAEDEKQYEVLIFNDDTSVTNNSDGSLWIRARFAGGQDNIGSGGAEPPVNDSSWICGKDGWHYYIHDIDFAQTTEPFVAPGAFSGDNANAQAVGTLRLDVQAVDQAWLIEKPESCREAFRMFENIRKTAEPIYL